ncbi:hypothetical protein MINTMi198_17980 [Mycobacterium intracellulare M.i.198]|uniref:recombinase family protein n=1 Tax=Mycobacterium intracellulare TaxID=1767 RepID=UPI000688A624|nr:recombinase family protein [Mycobacterium intracellulare]BCP36428.1 hypothetical protein MINTMi198_17980 [Mycobacterium intracellulare M.i.198]
MTQFLSGSSLTSIVARLNSENVLSPQDWERVRSGNPARGSRWHVDKLRKLLSNPLTQGIKTYKGKVILDAEGEPVLVGPASFDAETWGRLQSELEQRAGEPRARRHSVNPLLGVVKCAVCGRSMWQKSKHEKYRYYVCKCPKVSIRAEDAEELVEQGFLETHNGRRIRSRVWQPGSDNSAELEQTKKTIESLREDRAMGLFTTPADELMFRQQMTALLAKRDALSEQPVIRAGWTEVVSEETYGEVWPTATVEEKRKMLTDAGVTLTVTNPRQWHLHVESQLGVAASR